MRKHRHFALAIAALLTTGFVVQRSIPSAAGPARGGFQLASAVVRSTPRPVQIQSVSIRGQGPAADDHMLQLTSAIRSLPPAPPPPPPVPRPPVAAPATPSPGVWLELRDCESNDNYADDTGNGYYGAYQFSVSTWQNLGLSGLPSEAPPAQQDQAAQELEARSGWSQWPSCARRLGLT